MLFDPLDGGLNKLGRAHLALAHKFRQSNSVIACIFSNRHCKPISTFPYLLVYAGPGTGPFGPKWPNLIVGNSDLHVGYRTCQIIPITAPPLVFIGD